jgi:hypothetical protein
MSPAPTALTFPQLAVPCPRCEAPAGQLCTSHSGTRTRNSDTHQDRTKAHRAAQAAADEHQDEEQADPADVRDALAFNAAEPSPALATLRDVLLDTAPHTPHTAYAAARILLAAHARELANRAEQHITDHRIAEPTGRSVRALRTGMGSIRRLITQQAERLDDQAQQ